MESRGFSPVMMHPSGIRVAPPCEGGGENEKGDQGLGARSCAADSGSCTGWRVAHLKGEVDQATQQNVIASFGLPESTGDLAFGGTAWMYPIRPREACTTDILIFKHRWYYATGGRRDVRMPLRMGNNDHFRAKDAWR